MVDWKQEKIEEAMREAIEEAERRGLGVEETMQFISDYLINHRDPDVVAISTGAQSTTAEVPEFLAALHIVQELLKQRLSDPACEVFRRS